MKRRTHTCSFPAQWCPFLALNPETRSIVSPTLSPHQMWSGDDSTLGHCDLIHAVEHLHGGQSDSSVLYIPAVPLTTRKRVLSCHPSNLISTSPSTAPNIFEFNESTSTLAFLLRESCKFLLWQPLSMPPVISQAGKVNPAS